MSARTENDDPPIHRNRRVPVPLSKISAAAHKRLHERYERAALAAAPQRQPGSTPLCVYSARRAAGSLRAHLLPPRAVLQETVPVSAHCVRGPIAARKPRRHACLAHEAVRLMLDGSIATPPRTLHARKGFTRVWGPLQRKPAQHHTRCISSRLSNHRGQTAQNHRQRAKPVSLSAAPRAHGNVANGCCRRVCPSVRVVSTDAGSTPHLQPPIIHDCMGRLPTNHCRRRQLFQISEVGGPAIVPNSAPAGGTHERAVHIVSMRCKCAHFQHTLQIQ